jgi:uncharacterized protein (DUF58 family)
MAGGDERAYRVHADDLLALRGSRARLKLLRMRPARSALAGAHRSRYHGRGMDYRESRHYQAGDDIRNMDWRITARSGHPHVKVFDEERERPVVVLVDFSASMFFASQGVFKSVQAARVAALIGWSAILNGDRIGALLFADAVHDGDHRELAPAGGRRGQMRLIRGLTELGSPDAVLRGRSDATAADANYGVSAALARLRRVARPGSLVFLLSDFYGADAESERHLTQLARHNDVQALQIADPLELAPPPPGRYGISDGRRTRVLDTRSRAERERYASELEQHHRRVRGLTEACGVGLTRCLTTEDPLDCLTRLLAGGRDARADAGEDRPGQGAAR